MSLTPQDRRARASVRSAAAVDRLLQDLGSRLQRGSQAETREGTERLATGIGDIDRLIGGGIPTGRLSEIAGPASSGRTSVALALLARATQRGEVVALVDGAAALDPGSAEAAGAVLQRLLWARPPGIREAVRCCECLLEAHGFALVVLDLARIALRTTAPDAATWQRLARAAAGTGTALVVLSLERLTGTFSDLALEMQTTRAHFSDAPALLEGLEIQAVVARHRAGPVQRATSVRLSASSEAA